MSCKIIFPKHNYTTDLQIIEQSQQKQFKMYKSVKCSHPKQETAAGMKTWIDHKF